MSAEPLPAEPLPAEPLPTEPLPTEPLPTEPLPTEPPAVEATPAALDTPRRLRLRVLAATRRTLAVILMIAIFGLGGAVGYSTFVAGQPSRPVIGDPAIGDTEAPASVAELVAALAANDTDATRSAVPPQPFLVLTATMQGVREVRSVETLATYVDGPRTATHLILEVVQGNGVPVTINLTVLTQDGAIVAVR